MQEEKEWKKVEVKDLDNELLNNIEKYWRTANYMSVGQIYLLSNPLMRKEFTRDDVKKRLVGHFGTTPGLNFMYAHMSRVIKERNQEAMYIIGPGHGGPSAVAWSYLEGTYTETYPEMTKDETGLERLFRQFSFPGGIPSHVAPETPGSIHEGGELGYALSHAYGAAFDNPNLLIMAVVGDGEAETAALATSWHSNKFINPRTDGVVLPILHLNGYKIANPTILDRISKDELKSLMIGYGYKPYFFECGYDDEDHISIHRRYAKMLDEVMNEIADIKAEAQKRDPNDQVRPAWPMIIFRSPKGWTGPKYIDGQKTEGSWRAHQVPLANARDTKEHFNDLKTWLESYHPEELFDENGTVYPEILSFLPEGNLRMSASLHANGGLLCKDLILPDFKKYAIELKGHGGSPYEATRRLGEWLKEVVETNRDNFRIFGPDEVASNRLQASFDVTNKVWDAEIKGEDTDKFLGNDGQVVEMLSEHQMEGWLEAYNLTGRHGLFTSYEAFIHVIDSMFNQHAKWLRVARHLKWRKPVPSLNYLLSSHVWRQDHNGFSHQDPGFIDHAIRKQYEDMIRVYLPPDTNCLLSVYDHILRTKDRINVVTAGKQPQPTWLSMDEAIKHCERGLSVWEWAGTCKKGEEPDVVMACAGDVPTLETLAAVDLLKTYIPEMKIRVVNVVNLLKIQDVRENPHGITDDEFDALFTNDKPIIFAYHGYPSTIHDLTYRRRGHKNIHVRGFIDHGTTTTPFDMVMINNIDRYTLATLALTHCPTVSAANLHLRDKFADMRNAAKEYTLNGEDIPVVNNWVWPEARGEQENVSATIATGGDNE